MSELVKREVVKIFMDHIKSNNLDNPQQSVYKIGHSTESALMYTVNLVHKYHPWETEKWSSQGDGLSIQVKFNGKYHYGLQAIVYIQRVVFI